MLDKATITHKANQLLAELRANPDWAIDEKNFKQGYLKALECSNTLSYRWLKWLGAEFNDCHLDGYLSFILERK